MHLTLQEHFAAQNKTQEDKHGTVKTIMMNDSQNQLALLIVYAFFLQQQRRRGGQQGLYILQATS